MFFEGFEDFDLSFDFAFLDRLEHLDDHIFVISYCDSHVDFRVLPLSNFGDDLISVDVAE